MKSNGRRLAITIPRFYRVRFERARRHNAALSARISAAGAVTFLWDIVSLTFHKPAGALLAPRATVNNLLAAITSELQDISPETRYTYAE